MVRYIRQQGDTHTIGIIIFIVLVVSILCFAAFQGYIESVKRNASSSMNNNKTAEEMQRVVKSEMQKSDVDAIIGDPYECSESRAVRMDGKVRSTRRCSYGNPTIKAYLSVTYIDDKVWGTSYEERADK